jgi:hypothetical protein
MPILKPLPTKPASATIDDRITELHSQISAMIEDFVAREKATSPGIPTEWFHQNFRARFGNCLCRAYALGLKEKDA